MKNNLKQRNRLIGIAIVCIAILFFIFILTNAFGLRTNLFLDTKIHTWSNLQNKQIVQRAEQDQTILKLSGRVGWLAESVEVAITSSDMTVIKPKDWSLLDTSPKFTYFKGQVSVLPGWIKIFGRSQGRGYRLANGLQIGVGEVFIVAGQSNASGSSKTLFLSKYDNVQAGQLQEDGSILWKNGDDPQIRGGGGSPWPLVGDILFTELGMPIGFINVAKGGSSIRDWKLESDYFKQLIRVIEDSKPYGVRAILWHQGESDKGMTSDEYYTRLVTLIHEVQKVAKVNIPWLVARATYGSGKISESVRSAQKRLWDDGIAWQGPDTDSLGQPYRETSDRVHFNEAGTREVAKLWVEKIKVAFFDNN